MCGIAGIVDWKKKDHRETVKAMCDAMRHRGPDGSGIHQLNGCCLGHRRLSIIDLTEQGDQPMCNDDQRYWIIFNGEIYGFKDLRKTLGSNGVSFQSQSDTEVILQGFIKWGMEELCKRLSGMFAFAIWDEVEEKLYLARDRFGEKPLYYTRFGSEFRFSSNAKTLFIQASEVPELNPDGIVAYLHTSFCLPQFPAIRNLDSLLPGTFAVVEKSSLKVVPYWTSSFANQRVQPIDKWEEEIEEALKRAVDLELVSDVPVGCLLSGGVDSALISSIATAFKSDMELFTVRMPDSPLDESHLAKQVVKCIGGKHHIIDALPISVDEFIDFQSMFSEPLGDASSIALWMVAKKAKEQVTVVLTGDGGDELFAGYRTIDLNLRAEKYRHFLANDFGKLIASSMELLFNGKSSNRTIRKMLTFSQLISQSIKDYHIHRSFIPSECQNTLFGPRLQESAKSMVYLDTLYNNWDCTDASSDIDQQLQYDLKNSLLGDYLPKVDHSTMAHSLEARAPFLDHKLGEMAFSMPLEVKRFGGTAKGILKKILQKRIDPSVASLISKGKRGFVLPIDKWLDGSWHSLIANLTESPLVKEGWIDKSELDTILTRGVSQPEKYSRIRYSLLVLDLWYRKLAS